MGNPYSYVLEIADHDRTPAQEALQEALVDLLHEEPLANISIKRLCEQAFVARSTFYAYYRNTDELLLEVEDRLLCVLVRQNNQFMDPMVGPDDDLGFYTQTMDFVTEYSDVFRVLLIDHPDQRFESRWKDAIKYHFWPRVCDRSNAGLALEVVASSVIAAYTWWLAHPDEVDERRISRLVSGMLAVIDGI